MGHSAGPVDLNSGTVLMLITRHGVAAVSWLDAAVLSAINGLISTASLIIGVAAVSTDNRQVMTAGLVGLITGALSVAAREYLAAVAQDETDRAELNRERAELVSDVVCPRSTTPDRAHRIRSNATLGLVCEHLQVDDAVDVHSHNEFGMPAALFVPPRQAASVLAAMFATAGAIPLLTLHLAPTEDRIPLVAVVAVVSLASLGGIGAAVGGVSAIRFAGRVAFWGAAAIAVAALVGMLCGGTT